MKSELKYVSALAVLLLSSAVQSGGQERQKPAGLALDKLELRNVKAEAVHYLGRSAMRVTDAGPDGLDDSGRLAVVPGSSFQDGAIEVNLSGDTAPNAPLNLRGFVGIAFRITSASIFAPRTGARRISCSAIIPRNTSPYRDSDGKS